jgi:Thioredoxin
LYGPCKVLTSNLGSLTQRHSELLAVRLDVDQSPVTLEKSSVSALPTTVVFQKGKVAKTIAARSQAALGSALAPVPAEDLAAQLTAGQPRSGAVGLQTIRRDRLPALHRADRVWAKLHRPALYEFGSGGGLV